MTIELQQKRANTLAVNFGKILVNEAPFIADNYRKGMSQREITDFLREEYPSTVSEISSDIVLANAVGYALSGFNGSNNGRNYGGLMGEAEYLRMGEEHKRTALQNGRSVGHFTDYDLMMNAHLSAIKRGAPWTYGELLLLMGHTLNGNTAQQTAESLNDKFYCGQPVRIPSTVNNTKGKYHLTKKHLQDLLREVGK